MGKILQGGGKVKSSMIIPIVVREGRRAAHYSKLAVLRQFLFLAQKMGVVQIVVQ